MLRYAQKRERQIIAVSNSNVPDRSSVRRERWDIELEIGALRF